MGQLGLLSRDMRGRVDHNNKQLQNEVLFVIRSLFTDSVLKMLQGSVCSTLESVHFYSLFIFIEL